MPIPLRTFLPFRCKATKLQKIFRVFWFYCHFDRGFDFWWIFLKLLRVILGTNSCSRDFFSRICIEKSKFWKKLNKKNEVEFVSWFKRIFRSEELLWPPDRGKRGRLRDETQGAGAGSTCASRIHVGGRGWRVLEHGSAPRAPFPMVEHQKPTQPTPDYARYPSSLPARLMRMFHLQHIHRHVHFVRVSTKAYQNGIPELAIFQLPSCLICTNFVQYVAPPALSRQRFGLLQPLKHKPPSLHIPPNYILSFKVIN